MASTGCCPVGRVAACARRTVVVAVVGCGRRSPSVSSLQGAELALKGSDAISELCAAIGQPVGRWNTFQRECVTWCDLCLVSGQKYNETTTKQNIRCESALPHTWFEELDSR